MDEEAKRAIEEALHIVQVNAQERRLTTPRETQPKNWQQEEEPPDERQKELVQEEQSPTVTEREPSASTRTGKKRHWIRIMGLATGVMCLTVIMLLVIVPLFRSTATVTIIPKETTITIPTTMSGYTY